MNDVLTPADLSRELGVDQRKIRAFLRTEYGKLTPPEARCVFRQLETGQKSDNFPAI